MLGLQDTSQLGGTGYFSVGWLTLHESVQGQFSAKAYAAPSGAAWRGVDDQRTFKIGGKDIQ